MMVLTAYNADGNVSAVTAVNAATGNQVTQFVYGTTLATSGVASSLLKSAEVYPDSVGGSDQITFTYNRQGEQTGLTDQNGTVHAYAYDKLGRRTQDRVTMLGSGIDGAVRRIGTAYEVRGMAAKVTSYDNAAVGSGSIVNEVELHYNAFGLLAIDYQSHAGAVSTMTTPAVQYGYANGIANSVRPLAMTYPNGRVLNYGYGASGGIGDAASRAASLIDNDGTTHMADYSYLGQDSIVEVSEPQPTLLYTLVGTAGGNDPDTGDIYRGLDRFGRVKDLEWYNTATSAVVERVQHGYDRTGNRLWRKNPVDLNNAHDEFYAYDGLHRLKGMQRGTLNVGREVISAGTFEECWGLDATGNWRDFKQDNDGNGVWDLVQRRVSNPVNEITLINNSVGTGWVTPAYDPAGNMTTMPQPALPASSCSAVYDAWHRLVKLLVGGIQTAGYQHDGLNRRAVKQTYSGGVLSSTRHYFYSSLWQVLEERVGSSTNAERQFCWGQRYIDDVILRDYDPTGGGTLNSRFYGMQDSTWNLTAVADVSGTVQERYAYQAYGEPSILTPTFGMRSATQFDWEILFAGYRWDKESELYQVRNRTLVPLLGWLQRDPLGISSGVNLYQYVNCQPTRTTDPSGWMAVVDDVAVGSVVAACVASGICVGAVIGVVIIGIGVGIVYLLVKQRKRLPRLAKRLQKLSLSQSQIQAQA